MDGKSARFTVVNQDTNNVIFLSDSLLTKLGKSSSPSSSKPSAAAATAAATGSSDTRSNRNIPKSEHDTPRSNTYSSFNAPPPSSFEQPQFDAPRYSDSTYFGGGDGGDFARNDHHALREQYEQKLRTYQREWRARFSQMEKLNERLIQQNSRKLTSEVSTIDDKYFRNRSYTETPCGTPETDAMQCLRANASKPLLCGEQVRAFSACVNQAREDTLKQGL